jgi:quinol monooxygenase YgiN
MVIERVELSITPGQEAAFEAAMERGLELLRGADGCISTSLARGVERPSRYLMQLHWRSIDDHTAFTTTQAFSEFRALAGPHFAERPTMEHFQPIGPSLGAWLRADPDR